MYRFVTLRYIYEEVEGFLRARRWILLAEFCTKIDLIEVEIKLPQMT
jgi:hypothetical protein